MQKVTMFPGWSQSWMVVSWMQLAVLARRDSRAKGLRMESRLQQGEASLAGCNFPAMTSLCNPD
jgi:hypothetical protein